MTSQLISDAPAGQGAERKKFASDLRVRAALRAVETGAPPECPVGSSVWSAPHGAPSAGAPEARRYGDVRADQGH